MGSVHRRFRSPLNFFEELKKNYGDAVRFRLFNERFLLFSDPTLVDPSLEYAIGATMNGIAAGLHNTG